MPLLTKDVVITDEAIQVPKQFEIDEVVSV